MSRREELLDSLIADLKPVAVADLRRLAAVWFLLSAVYVVAVTQLMGPVRATALEQLHTHPRFLAEMILGSFLAVGLGIVAFRSAVPGGTGVRLRLAVVAAGVLWVGGFLLGLAFPALEPSMLGKREHCFLETFVYALPPLLVALYWQRRLYPLSPGRSAMLAGLAAGVLPALYMQIACMYIPAHILQFHIAPGAAVALVAPLLLYGLQRVRFSRG